MIIASYGYKALAVIQDVSLPLKWNRRTLSTLINKYKTLQEYPMKELNHYFIF